MANYLWFFVAAILEIGGCYTFWMWLRLEKSIFWLCPGIIMLTLFALVLTRIDAQFAGRAYAAYGGIYIISSLAWLVVIEQTRPLLTDYIGVVLCLVGAIVILSGPRLILS